MLDKIDFQVLDLIMDSTVDGQFSVLERDELLRQLEKVGGEELEASIEKLELHEMIAVRYSDPEVVCLTSRPKGRLACEKRNLALKTAAATAPAANPQPFTAATIAGADVPAAQQDAEEYYDGEGGITVNHIEPNVKINRKTIFLMGLSAFCGGFIAVILNMILTKWVF